MLRVGLTGGIASGKSLVAARFERMGVPVSDADRASRTVVAPGSPGLREVVDAFGRAVLGADGTLDRATLRRRVFADPEARTRLERILHPRIRAQMDREIDRAASAGHAYALAVVPLLVETGRFDRHDRILVVDAPPAVQRARLCARDAVDPAGADRMLASQAGRWERLRHADDVVTNAEVATTEAAIDCQVRSLDRKYRALSGLRPGRR